MISLFCHTLFPVTRPPLHDVYISCREGRIEAISSNRPDGEIRVVEGPVFPALINAHTHLEFSDLKVPLGQPGMPFVEWIQQVIGHRREKSDRPITEALLSGIRESVESGVAAVGEIATVDWMSDPQVAAGLQQTELDLVVFRELIGYRDSNLEPQLQTAFKHLVDAFGWPSSTTRAGLCPHAPYSTDPFLVDFAAMNSRDMGFPVAFHLAESREELQFLDSQTGPFRELLERVGVWEEGIVRPGTRPLHYLQKLSACRRALVVHGNYLTETERQFIAERSDRLSLVYCPRTHHYFSHEPYPLDSVLELGLPLALGTDSRASNPDLSIWNEMEFAFAQHSGVNPHAILEMGTLNGAVALGLEQRFGSLEVGKAANFLIPLEKDLTDASSPLLDALLKAAT